MQKLRFNNNFQVISIKLQFKYHYEVKTNPIGGRLMIHFIKIE